VELNTIHIACATDDNYAQHCAVTLYSLLENNPDNEFVVYILISTLTDESKGGITRSLEVFSNKTIKFVEVDDTPLDGIDLGRFGKAAFYRALLPEYLDQSVNKVLYIDVDLAFTGSIEELWNTDLNDNYCAAVENPFYKKIKRNALVGIAEDAPYFNTGVLLINIPKWRNDNVFEKVKELSLNPDLKFTLPDQDALNKLFENKWISVHPKWNAMGTYFMLNDLYKNPAPESTNYFFCESAEKIVEAAEKPVIIHYTHDLKPWHYGCYHSRRTLYIDALQKTTWSGYKFPDKSITVLIKRIMNQTAIKVLSVLPRSLKNKIVAKVFA